MDRATDARRLNARTVDEGIERISKGNVGWESEARAIVSLVEAFYWECYDKPPHMAVKPNPSGRDAYDEQLRQSIGKRLVGALDSWVGVQMAFYGDPKRVTEIHGIFKQWPALEQTIGRCQPEVLARLDPDNHMAHFSEAFNKASFIAKAQRNDEALMASLAEVKRKRDPKAIVEWDQKVCRNKQNSGSFCAPKAAEALAEVAAWETLIHDYFGQEGYGKSVFKLLADKHGDAMLKGTMNYLRTGPDPSLRGRSEARDLLLTFLNDRGAFKGCKEKKIMDALFTADAQDAYAIRDGIWLAMKNQCTAYHGQVISAMAHKSHTVRIQAVYSAGEMNIQKAKNIIRDLMFTDPYWGDGCTCYPVRDAAKKAYNVLNVKGA